MVQGFQEFHHFEESRLRRNHGYYISLESSSHVDHKYMLTFSVRIYNVRLCAIVFSPFW
jgi:hypothetical protein